MSARNPRTFDLIPNLLKSIVPFFQNTVYGANVVIFEGILAFADKRLTDVS